ncbi:MAG: helix-turn-helix transcriptional regulator, partial [Anaerotignum sp.]|nr:helix-turn-helix transcriptional regulator [Anaerotignum sp.]
LTQVRIEAACRELETTDVPASEISVMIGYDDPRYFYKVFKKKLGVTPKEYRQKQL